MSDKPDEQWELHWSGLFQLLRKKHGVSGSPDPGGAAWRLPGNVGHFRTAEMYGSAESDFRALRKALFEKGFSPSLLDMPSGRHHVVLQPRGDSTVFVEIENELGRSVRHEWRQRADGLFEIVLL